MYQALEYYQFEQRNWWTHLVHFMQENHRTVKQIGFPIVEGCETTVQLKDLGDKVDHWLNRQQKATGATVAEPVPVPAAETGPAVLNEAIIEELSSFGAEFVVSLSQELIASVPGRLADVQTAVDEGDAERLARSAHALRGSSANMGGARLAQVCAQLEEAGERGDLAEAARLVPALETEAAQLIAALSRVIEVAV